LWPVLGNKELTEGQIQLYILDYLFATKNQYTGLRWYGHVLQKEDNDWLKECMKYEVEGSRSRGRPKRTCTEVVQKDCQAHKSNRDDTMDHSRWMKLIKDG